MAFLSATEIEAVDLALGYYGNMSGVELIGRTHQESPWKNVYDPSKKHIIISKESIYDFYREKFVFSDE